MNEAHGMNSLQGQNDLSDVKPSPVLGHVIIGHEVDQVPARHEIHHHVQVLVVLKGVVQLNDPLGVGMRHDVTLFPKECTITTLDLKRNSYFIDFCFFHESFKKRF